MSTSARVEPSHAGPSLHDPRSPSVTSSATASQDLPFLAEVVVLTTNTRICLWLLLVAIVLVNTALLVIFAAMYQFYDSRNSVVWSFRVFYLSYAGNQFVKQAAPIVAAGYAILAALFVLYAMYFVFVSVRMRGLHFGAKGTVHTSTRRVSVSRTVFTIDASRSCCTQLYYLVKRVRYLVGVQGPYFELRLLVDDLFELGSQSAAAYSSSRSISNVNLNLAYGIVICLTSICPLVFRRIFKTSLVKQRVAGLVADLVLDFVWGTLLPLWMLVPVVQIAIGSKIGEEFDVITSLTREIERVLILSWKNYILSVFPFIATLLNLIEIQSILREVQPGSRRSIGNKAPSGTTVLKLTYAAVPRRHGLFYRLAHTMFPLYGFAVLVTTIVATRGSAPSSTRDAFDCIHRVYPWFETEESCAGRRINCTSVGITGTSEQLESAFDTFNARLLTDLLITDCRELTLPRRLRRLNHLQSIVLKNSYVVSWGAEAGVTELAYLRAVNLNLVAFATLPEGLVSKPLASNVEYIHLAEIANATQVLDAVGTNWEKLRFFDCMACGLTELHPSIKAMHQLSMLAILLNDIATIPEDWTVNPEAARLDAIWLDGNIGLQTIPDSLWRQTATCAVFSVEFTNLSAVPAWLPEVADAGLHVYAASTPLCAAVEAIPAHVRPLIKCDSVYF